MLKEILIVDSLTESIKQWGIQFFHNQIIQEMAGQYWFVDVDPECDDAKDIVSCGKCSACIHPLPLKIAYFIIQARRMQLEAFKLAIPGNNDDIKQPELISYIPAGVKFRGKTYKNDQTIPAELGVIHWK